MNEPSNDQRVKADLLDEIASRYMEDGSKAVAVAVPRELWDRIMKATGRAASPNEEQA